MFVPLGYAPAEYVGARLTVRMGSNARAAVPRLREVIREVEPYAAVDDIWTVAERSAERIREARLANLMALVISVAALLLASLGLYAIIAYAVAQRTREIGVRLAIGAEPGRVVREFFRHGMTVSAFGLAIGLPLTVVGIRLLEASLLGFTLRNVLAVMLMVPVLLGVAALASWLPARRAGQVDPLIALQAE
jgi:ABC-type antimicrobial peptide transport system permease subunit